MPQSKRHPVVLGAIDLGAHSARMLIAQCGPAPGVIEILEDLDVSVPLGSNVFHTGAVSAGSIRILCDIFENFRLKMQEYGVTECRAVATSAVREASNAEILLERIRHATGIRVQLYEGSDEARLNYLSVTNTLPETCGFDRKKAMIADIGTGACQVSTYNNGSMTFTETLKIGTLRILENLSGVSSVASLRDTMTPVIASAFSDLEQSGVDLHGEMLVAMGASVRMLLRMYFRNSGKGEITSDVCRITRKEFESLRDSLDELAISETASHNTVRQELAEAVMPCAILLSELFRVTEARELLIPMISLKQGLMFDFANEILTGKDDFEDQTLGLVRSVAAKYRCDTEFLNRVEANAMFLFRKLAKLHGLGKRELLLLRIAAILHKCGLYLNNQAYHKHSAYIINATEIPGISLVEREIVSFTVRYHRKSEPKVQHHNFQALPGETRGIILKLSAILRIACLLSLRGITAERLKLRTDGDRILIRGEGSRSFPVSGPTESADLDYFFYVFAMQVILQ